MELLTRVVDGSRELREVFGFGILVYGGGGSRRRLLSTCVKSIRAGEERFGRPRRGALYRSRGSFYYFFIPPDRSFPRTQHRSGNHRWFVTQRELLKQALC